MAELIVKIKPELYRKHLHSENGKPVLYVRLKKALYGTMRASLLFWENLVETLQEWGFEINPYDWCVANKDIQGSWCKVVWHVGNLKISHANSKVVTEMIEKLQAKYGGKAHDSSIWKVHEYLGIQIGFSDAGK
eukprot:5915075-Ditylum_brightwellii.AAC.1